MSYKKMTIQEIIESALAKGQSALSEYQSKLALLCLWLQGELLFEEFF